MASEKESAPTRSRYSNLRRSFQLGTRSLLTSISKEDVDKSFSTFSDAEREKLHRTYNQVIRSLHENLEEEFDSLCQETQASVILDTIEQLIEEQKLDVLSRDRTNIEDVKQKISKSKQNEVKYLTDQLRKAEEQNKVLSAHVMSLRERRPGLTVIADAVEKLRSFTSHFER